MNGGWFIINYCHTNITSKSLKVGPCASLLVGGWDSRVVFQDLKQKKGTFQSKNNDHIGPLASLPRSHRLSIWQVSAPWSFLRSQFVTFLCQITSQVEFVPSCSIMFHHVQSCSIMFRHVPLRNRYDHLPTTFHLHPGID